MDTAAKSIFIGGTGRTGTNLVKEILSTSPENASLPFETRFVTDPDGVVPTALLLKSVWSPFIAEKALKRHLSLLKKLGRRSSIDRFYSRITSLTGRLGREIRTGNYSGWELARWFPDYWEKVLELQSDLTAFSYPGLWVGSDKRILREKNVLVGTPYPKKIDAAFSKFLNGLYNEFTQQSNASFYVDDNTFNIVYAESIYNLVADSHFVLVERDPRDVVTSYLGQGWAPDDIWAASLFYRSLHGLQRDALQKIPVKQITRVRYENLCHSPSDALSPIFQRTGMNSDLVKTESIRIVPTAVRRWKRELSKYQVSILEDCLRKEIKEYSEQ